MSSVGQQAAPAERTRPGSTLPPSVRGRMEAVVGGDLSAVAVHTDAQAADRAAAERTLAVTQGRDIEFARGAYRPGTVFGEALLAHELAHARQQQGGSGREEGGVAGSARGLEGEADRAGLVAAARLADPAAARRLPAPRVSTGHGLRLQGCSVPEYPEIGELPDRQHYESNEELEPIERGQEPEPLTAKLEPGAAPPPLPAGAAPATPLPEPDPAAPELTAEELSPRLLIMEQRQEDIEALVDDVPRGLGIPATLTFRLIRSGLVAGGGGWSLRDLTQALPRAEEVQQRVEDALLELVEVKAMETASRRAMEQSGYDLAGSEAAIDEVRLAYAEVTDVLLSDDEVTALGAADARRDRLDVVLLGSLAGYYEQRAAPGADVAEAVSAMQDWASLLAAEVARLMGEASEIGQARARGDAGADRRAQVFARDAQLVVTSLDALTEWDYALSAYEALQAGSGLSGEDAIVRIAARLNQMKEASVARDEPYLRLLLRDHRADEAVADFYESVPEIITNSQRILGFLVTLVAAAATAGVGVVVAGAAAGAAAAAEGAAVAGGASASAASAEAAILLEYGMVARVGAEAATFTALNRLLLSQLPGMEPTTSAAYDLAWNLALFGALRIAGSAVGGTVSRNVLYKSLGERAQAWVMGGAHVVSGYATLEAYGYLHFVYENGRLMTPSELLTMSRDNLVMLAGLSIALVPLTTVLPGLEASATRGGRDVTGALLRFHARYGGRFASIDARRAELETRLRQVIEENPKAGKKDVADIESEADALDAELELVVDEAMNDKDVDVEALRADLGRVTSVIQTTPLPELLGDMGLDPTVDLRVTGDPATWTYAPGKGEVIATFLTDSGVPVTSDTVAGQIIMEAVLAGRGPVSLVERGRVEVDVELRPATGPAGGVLDALVAKDEDATVGLAAVRDQTVIPELAARIEAASDDAALVMKVLRAAGKLARARASAPPPAAVSEAAAEAFDAVRSHALAVEAALLDTDAQVGLTKLTSITRYKTAHATILAAAPPENVAPFLRALADPGMGYMDPEFYQGLARSRPACDLITRWGSDVFFKVVNLQGDNPQGLRVARARADIERVLRGLNALDETDPTAAKALRDQIAKFTDKARPSKLDPLVGPRPPAGRAFEADVDDPQWGTYRAEMDDYSFRRHPLKPDVTQAELHTRTTLLQTVHRAWAGEFADYTPQERTYTLEQFDQLARGARLDRGWTSSRRGELYEALALGRAQASDPIFWLNRVPQPRSVGGCTIPDEYYPPVRPEDLLPDPADGIAPIMKDPRTAVERKSYMPGGRSKARATARKHLAEVKADLPNLPEHFKVSVEYADPYDVVEREAMRDIFFHPETGEPRIERVVFGGIVYPR